MLNFTGIAKAPEWRVEMHRKRSLSEAQNARRKAVYVIAPDPGSAMQIAARKNPEFVAVSARKTT